MIRFDAGERFRLGATHEQNAAGLDDGTLAVFLHRDTAGPVIFSPALHPFHFVFLEKKFDALGMLGDNFGFAGDNVGPVDLQAGNFEAQLRGILEMIVNIGVMQQNFCGDAANVETSTAEKRILLDHHGL